MARDIVAPSPDEKKPIPRRNLTETFEAALCGRSVGTTVSLTSHGDSTGAEKELDPVHSTKESEPFFSPTSVTQHPMAPVSLDPPPYEFNLHRDLSRDLPPAVISRVSMYAVIHDVNKEAASMAANDPLNKEDNKEELSPLVQAVTGSEATKEGHLVKNAMIDEETWLLDAIMNRNREGEYEIQACPPTFPQAMGEKEYENPVHALSGASRTQLWKPSRSWWEAKSGKNPWIEPNSHNKRWRYLWPFIHYHKFLAKCIKKLKRNGADVKHSVSPVAVFLREEVCAISDHLAAVSLFGSEEWMKCLQHFTGWTDETAEDLLLAHVRRLKLRPLNEPGDVDSTLLRSQIDEHFLKAMAAQREQLREIPTTIEAPHKKERGPPPMHPRSSPANNAGPTSASPQLLHPTGFRRSRYPLQQPQQPQNMRIQQPYSGGYDPHMVYADNSSVQSGISIESGLAAAQYSDYQPQPPMAHQYAPYYAPPLMYCPPGTQYHQQQQQDLFHSMQHHQAWLDPALAPYGVSPYFAGVPLDATPSQDFAATTDKEEKEDHTSEVTPSLKGSPMQSPPQHQKFSPYWSHLVDGAAQSLVTPAKSPSTPIRPDATVPVIEESPDHRAPMAAQPLLLRGYPYGYGHYGARGGYAPPSPATQFMMAPTPTNQLFYGGYSSSLSPAGKQSEPPTPVRKMVELVSEESTTDSCCCGDDEESS